MSWLCSTTGVARSWRRRVGRSSPAVSSRVATARRQRLHHCGQILDTANLQPVFWRQQILGDSTACAATIWPDFLGAVRVPRHAWFCGVGWRPADNTLNVVYSKLLRNEGTSPLDRPRRDVILYELNEVPWDVVDIYVNNRPTSHIAALLREGQSLTTVHEDREERRVGKECRSRWSPYH